MSVTFARQHPNNETTIRVLRDFASHGRLPRLRMEIAADLTRNIQAFIDHHPRAHHCVIDAGTHYQDFWQLSEIPAAPIRQAFARSEAEAHLQSRVLVELLNDVNGVLVATCVAYLAKDIHAAEALVRTGLRTHGHRGHAAQLSLWVGMIQQARGEVGPAVQTYQAVASSPIAPVRRSALASGLFAASSTGENVESGWFLERMADEDATHQRALFERVKQLRRNRMGHHAVEASLRHIQQSIDASSARSRWISGLVER